MELSYGHPDMDIALHMVVASNRTVCVLYDKPFTKELSWVEYDAAENRLDFIMDDGDVRNFGIPVPGDIQPYMHEKTFVAFIERQGEELITEQEIPLITRQ